MITSAPSEIRDLCEKAISFYPELDEVEVAFVYHNNIEKSVMQAQPKFTSMFWFKKKRTYLVRMRRSFDLNGNIIPINDLPNDVLIGWLGHELGHIMDYRERSDLALVVFGLLYLFSKRFIISAERAADTYAVNHGLGDYILRTKDFILNEAGMSEAYIKRMSQLYLPPEEIIDMMEKKAAAD
jgi:hypothetical protein